MARDCLSRSIGLVRLLGEGWGPFTRALQSSLAFSGRRTLERALVQLVASPASKFCLSSDEVLRKPEK